jgi:hypothetical protein
MAVSVPSPVFSALGWVCDRHARVRGPVVIGVPLGRFRPLKVVCASVAAVGVLTFVSLSPASVSDLANHAPGTIRISPNGALWTVRGLDPVSHSLYVWDVTDNGLLVSDDWGQTFSADKGLPTGVTSVNKVVRFKSKIYMSARDAATRLVGVYSAAPTPGNTRLRWSGPTITISRPAALLQTDFNSDSRYLYLGQYGDPRPGPRLYRSSDGIHWTTVFGPARGIRHVHGVAADPYQPGTVWMTLGDGVTPSVLRSTRYGARGSWRVMVGSSAWQSVQISFDRMHVYLAGDASGHGMFFVVDKKTLKPQLGTPHSYRAMHPPGSPRRARYLVNAYFGAVDPHTGIYYCAANDDSEQGTPRAGAWNGFFAVRHIGGRVIIVDPGGVGIGMNSEVFVGGGRVWSGQWSVPALR